MPMYGSPGAAFGLSYVDPNVDAVYATTQIGIGTLQFVPMVIPGAASFTAADVFVSNSFSATNAASSQAHTISASIALYTRLLSTLSLASSGSQTYAFTVTGSSSSVSYQGLKNMTIPINANMTPGNYWYAINSSTASAGHAIAAAFSNVVDSIAGAQSAYQGVFGQSTAVSMSPELGLGQYSVSTAAFPAAVGLSEIVGSAIGATAEPIVNFKNFSA